jgi:hypothetical protein
VTSNATRDWCKFGRTGAAFIEPGSPWENPYVESSTFATGWKECHATEPASAEIG